MASASEQAWAQELERQKVLVLKAFVLTIFVWLMASGWQALPKVAAHECLCLKQTNTLLE
jgi:hypothetical protein